jgi:magnesium chelatase family protein
MLSTVKAFVLDGIVARPVRVEVDVHRGLPSFAIVGLPDAALRESRERVRAALINCGFEFPLRRVVVNVGPASVRRSSPALDLAIAAALLGASGQLSPDGLAQLALVGELALDGTARPVNGALPFAEAAREEGVALVVPTENAAEAALLADADVLPVASLAELPTLLAGKRPTEPPAPVPFDLGPAENAPDLADLGGQPRLRRALEVAAAGPHSLLILAPPGAGASLAAARLPSILPALSRQEAIEVARIASACGRLGAGLHGRPFRAPHHTISPAGLLGGGTPERPGEVTLAHRGVLFLGELSEFRAATLEGLHATLRSGEVWVKRGAGTRSFPACFVLVATAMPCPCGNWGGDPACRCSPVTVGRYRSRLMGSAAAGVDLCVTIRRPSASEIGGPPGETSAEVRERVVAARERRRSVGGSGNDAGDNAGVTLRISRTIADLEGSSQVRMRHAQEALELRRGVV